MLKRIKALFLFLFFIGIAVIIVWQRGRGVASFLDQYDLALEIWVVAFIVSAIANLVVAIKDTSWQVLGYVAWFMYTIATWFAISHGQVPIIAGWIYTGMCVMFIFDVWSDIKGVIRWVMNLLS